MKIVGIDEAGKGPVIGPMCIGGVRIDKSKINALKNLGVADSKKLSPKKRVHLASQIKKYADDYYVFEVSPDQIDELRKLMTMNEIMVLGFGNVIENLSGDEIYVDAADVKEERFGKRLLENYLKNHPDITVPKIVSKHGADDLFPIVSAASIIAKVRRDELIEELKKDIGVDFGSGYPSDPKTKKFLKDWYDEHGSLPDIVRHSWKTAQNIVEK
ncbi:ribonuclease HII [Methanococcoides orientis]|uniref:ribonuclease HII n=1 Tax=Methanococcoides orientis TaxID=2822137 RepID=UPI001E57558F|nr:ribonuclease HII [Methanococcoides orientis]UGV41227.1 ribonuclease HII [Methanococcoides orientis]